MNQKSLLYFVIMKFEPDFKFKPMGDQKQVIESITDRLFSNKKFSTIEGATGTGKTFSVANIIAKYKKPTLVMAPNKTLANQLYVELKQMFPNNRVEYYISNFDFYQPEAYKPTTDTYIEKSSVQNWQIEMMRNSALSALTSRDDVIVVASVAAIYGHRSPDEYTKHHRELVVGQKYKRIDLIRELVEIGYERKEEQSPGSVSVKGDVLLITPSWSDRFHLRVEMFGDEIDSIAEVETVSKKVIKRYDKYTLFPGNSNVVSKNLMDKAIERIKIDLKKRLKELEQQDLQIEKQRLEARVNFDIEQLEENGFTSGIENYAWYFEDRGIEEPPFTLLDYFPDNFLTVIDESHLSIPQLHGMYHGDRSRKETLVDYGFRLPAALANRPLKFNEFIEKTDKVVFVSATPGDYELEQSKEVATQVIRPTGLLDPELEVRPSSTQVEDLLEEINIRKARNERVLINTTTRKLSESIADYYKEQGLSVAYLHHELKTFERDEVIRKLRTGFYDAVVGINLLREGLDIPEVSLMAIFDADHEGFLRDKRSLIQMIGRAARNSNGKAILYANKETGSIKAAIEETNERRKYQLAYNKKHKIVPTTIVKDIPKPLIEDLEQVHNVKLSTLRTKQKLELLEKDMKQAADEYDFERAIKIRDMIIEIKDGK